MDRHAEMRVSHSRFENSRETGGDDTAIPLARSRAASSGLVSPQRAIAAPAAASANPELGPAE